MVSNTWDHDGDGNTPEITRWESLHAVVDLMVTSYDDKINFGAALYPDMDAEQAYNSSACTTDASLVEGADPDNGAAILAAIPAATGDEADIKGGTPSASGVQAALDHLAGLDPENPQAIFFITDGAANCSEDAQNVFELFEVYDDNLHTIVGDAWTDDAIPTYVVGIDISQENTGGTQDGNPNDIVPFDKLNELANEGGTPTGGAEDFYSATNQAELEDALTAIADSAVSCTVPLDPEPPFPELLEIYIADTFVPQVDDCLTENGWVYTNPNGPYDSIELCGDWCTALKESGELTAEYYCDPG
jgi:hypothetical protein